jgi:hypothetical protein
LCKQAYINGLIFDLINLNPELKNHPHYCAGDKIEKNEMGGALSLDRRGERHVQGFGGET